MKGESMDFGAITQAVGAVGFPIVIALLAAWYIKYLGDKNSETVDRMQTQIMAMNEKQNEQLDKMTEAIAEVNKSIAVLNNAIAKGLTE